MDTRHRTFRIPADLDEKLEERAKQLDRSASWVILRCLEIELDRGVTKQMAASRVRGVR
jgi:predicted transcriptional regulator